MQVQRVQVDMINVLVCKLLSSYQISLCLCELADAAASHTSPITSLSKAESSKFKVCTDMTSAADEQQW